MLDIKFIRNNKEEIERGIASKGYDPEMVAEVLALDRDVRRLQHDLEQRQARLKSLSAEIAKQFGQKKLELIKEATELSKTISEKKPELTEVKSKFHQLMLRLPNLPAKDVKLGKESAENEVVRSFSQPKKFDFPVKDHLELGEALSLIDVRRGVKVAGSRFAFLRSEAVVLHFALINFAFAKLMKEGFIPVLPPELVNERTVLGTGYLPLGEEEVYRTSDDLYLIGTAELPLIGMHQDEVLEADKLPLRYVGFSSAFRREAGSYGKDIRGIFRMHQFEKVEMVSFVLPKDSEKELEFFLSLEESIMQELKIPYRVVKMCTADLGVQAAKKYDIEAWLPSQNCYRETHSTSSTTDFQSRRLNIRYRDTDGRVELVHTLNGTVVAIGRMLIAIFENYQQKDGSIEIPEALRPYCGFRKIEPLL